ncbi:uncharacterized protein LOC114579770 [Dendrobium catenatum]|uniref:Uncharacterized protein n=1 Tax=Dendrobium catenatum TaxID=906689 RepID=A0A2I0XH59_9ASPA|nr:uncharacterized protein LOC114579770 [Dendrobium catenatum]PKU87256.1 hypothetical protein MA16_Dca009404 [Dendrobium catenatum]
MMRETIRLGCRVKAKRRGKENKGITAAMLATERAMVVVSVLLVSAIVSPVSIELGSCDLHCRFHERAFAAPKSSGFMLFEHEIVGRMIVDLQAQVDKGVKDRDRLLSSVELLRSSSVGLKEGVEKLDAAIDGGLEVVIRGRNEILGVLSVRDRSFYEVKLKPGI